MIRWTRYVGSKQHFVEEFNKVTAGLDCETYVEPFFGSGAIFFNLTKTYKRYVINDSNPHVINALKAFYTANYQVYKKAVDGVFSKFGDVKANKPSYYAFRNWFNETYFDGKGDSVLEGLYFHMLMNSCINSLVRIGPNGFNQSWGNRFLELKEEEYNQIHEILRDRKPVFMSVDYSEVVEEYDGEDVLFFMDPPYFERPTVGYKQDVKGDKLKLFLERLKGMKGKIVYTDILSVGHTEIEDWPAATTKELKSVSPLRTEEVGASETYFRNFGETNKSLALF